MSAFQPYAGVYEISGDVFSWRCYATVRIHEIRHNDHGPFAKAPVGKKWVWPKQQAYEPCVACLVDESVGDFSQILLQVTAPPKRTAQSSQRRAPAAAIETSVAA